MRSYHLIAPAKINLLLEIVGDRPDGFHELVMVMQSVDLADELELKPLGGDRISLHCTHPQVPLDESNLAYRAAKLMQDCFPGRGGVDITIQKKIPIGAGLAGGSADGAAVLVGLDLMWNLGLTQDELCALAAKLGSDMPFCISGGTALALGRGEELSPLPDLDRLYAVLAKYQSLSVSTPWAYQTYRHEFGATYANTPAAQQERRRTGPSVGLLGAIAHRDPASIGRSLHNDLEKVVLGHHPQVGLLREKLAIQSPLGAMMSGSGPTVFALAATREEAQRIATQIQIELPDPDLEVWVTKFIGRGIHLAESEP
ncbi:4-(cytidine 5'-diphospho)-2-C-methyl-D-erythritol kinase [Altericista sp. CCNU0014]|uniref:4-(cytidine 5'-diphospho)-2-C-methyl-D-erythritol kinase n=1 Tax=Altericista sp. CCNU0014 TaxID=3082949 RepID=UPI00384EE2EE